MSLNEIVDSWLYEYYRNLEIDAQEEGYRMQDDVHFRINSINLSLPVKSKNYPNGPVFHENPDAYRRRLAKPRTYTYSNQ